MTRQDRANRVDVWEHRSLPAFDLRADSSADTLTFSGYASTFEPYDMYGGPANGVGWVEQLGRNAYDATLRESPDLHLLINHEGMPLARTKSGTLHLSVDDQGLKVVAELNRNDPDVQRLEPKMWRGDMDEMSFAFRVRKQEWSAAPGFEDDDQSLRTITDVNLHKGDVSIVNFGANPTTSAEIKSVDQAIKILAHCEPEALAEARSGNELPSRARSALEKIGAPEGRRAPEAGKRGMSLRDALIRQGLADIDGPLSVEEALKRLDGNK